MNTVRDELAEVATDFGLYTDKAQRTDQRRIIVEFLAEFYGVSVCDVDDLLEK